MPDSTAARACSGLVRATERARAAVESGKFDLTVEQRESTLGYIDTVVNARRAAENHERALRDYERRERASKAEDSITQGILQGTLRGRALADAIATSPDLEGSQRRTLTAFAHARASELGTGSKKSDPQVFNSLYMSIIAPEGTPGKVYSTDAIFAAVQAGKLNTNDAERLRGIVMGQKDEDGRTFRARAHGRLSVIAAAMRSSPEYQAQPELAAAIQVELGNRVEQASLAARKAGNPPDELLNPESKDYLFKPGFIKSVADDVKQQLRGTGLTLEPGAIRMQDGKRWEFRGGDPKLPANWREVKLDGK